MLFQQSYNAGARIQTIAGAPIIMGLMASTLRNVDKFMWITPTSPSYSPPATMEWIGMMMAWWTKDSIGSPGNGQELHNSWRQRKQPANGAGWGGIFQTGRGPAWPSDYATNPSTPITSAITSTEWPLSPAAVLRMISPHKAHIVAPGTNIVSIRSSHPSAGSGWGVIRSRTPSICTMAALPCPLRSPLEQLLW